MKAHRHYFARLLLCLIASLASPLASAATPATKPAEARTQRYFESIRNNPNLLQAPLYLMAVEKFFGLKAAGMYYIGLKGGVEPAGWESAELPADWLDESRAWTLAIVDQIRAGRIEVAPSDRDKCRFCDCADVCRIEIAQPETAAEGA